MVDSAHRRAIVLALLVTALWSTSWVIIRFGLDNEGLRPLTFAGVRYLLAGLVLLAACLIGPRTRQSLRSVRGREPPASSGASSGGDGSVTLRRPSQQ